MSEKFSVFGIGKDGIPSYFRRWFAEGGDKKVEDAIWQTADQSDDAKTVMLVLDEWRGEEPNRLAARAMAMGIISPDTNLPLPSAAVREMLGFPPRLNKFREFSEVAGREAIALAFTVRRDRPELVPALEDIVARVREGQWALSVNALAAATRQNWDIVDDTALRELDKLRNGISRSTIAGGRKRMDGAQELGWRDYPQYRHIVTEVAGHLALRLPARQEKWSDKDIRDIATKAPVATVLELVDGTPTVSSATPRASAGRFGSLQRLR